MAAVTVPSDFGHQANKISNSFGEFFKISNSKNDLTVTGRKMRDGAFREFGMNMYPLLYLKWIINKGLPHSTWNSARCYVAGWMEGKFGGRVDTWVCLAGSPRCPPETVTTLFVGDFPGGPDFPDSSVGKESASNARDSGSIPGSGRSPGERIGYPLQYSWASLVWLSW